MYPLLDTGLSSNLVSEELAEELTVTQCDTPILAEFANGTESIINCETVVPLEVAGVLHEVLSLVDSTI